MFSKVPPGYFTDGGFAPTLAMLAWYCMTFPSRYVCIAVVYKGAITEEHFLGPHFVFFIIYILC